MTGVFLLHKTARKDFGATGLCYKEDFTIAAVVGVSGLQCLVVHVGGRNAPGVLHAVSWLCRTCTSQQRQARSLRAAHLSGPSSCALCHALLLVSVVQLGVAFAVRKSLAAALHLVAALLAAQQH
jgi:hypothetical protein